MILTAQARGAQQLRAVAQALRAAGRDDLRRQLLAALRQSTAPLRTAIPSEIHGSVPAGYAAVLVGAITVTASARTAGWPSLTVVAQAPGRKELRDLPSVNKGILRHPVYGRHRPTKRTPGGKKRPWVVQKVRGGFFDRAVDAHLPHVVAAAEDALEDVARRIAGS